LPFVVRFEGRQSHAELRLCRLEGVQNKALARIVVPGALDAGAGERLGEVLRGCRIDLEVTGLEHLTGLRSLGIVIVAIVASTDDACGGAPDSPTLLEPSAKGSLAGVLMADPLTRVDPGKLSAKPSV
jgi:hypothetical protein